MSAIANSQPPVPPDENPPGASVTNPAGDQSAPAAVDVAPGGPERAISSFPPRLVPYKVEASPGYRRSNRLAGKRLPAPSPTLAAASAQYIEDTHKEFMKMNREVKEKRRKRGLQVEAQGSPIIPIPRSHNPSRDPSPTPAHKDQTLFDDERLYAKDIDITDGIPPADRAVSLAPADPATYTLAPPKALPGTNRPTPAPHSPLPAEDDNHVKKVVDTMLYIATRDILDRLAVPVVLNPPGNEKLALPQIVGGPFDQLRTAMQRRAACPFAKAEESHLTPVELRLWGGLHEQLTRFADEVSDFMKRFDVDTHTEAEESMTNKPGATLQNQFVWTGDDVALAMQATIFATSGVFISWDRALQCAHDFDAAHKAHVTPLENNALGLSVDTPTQLHNPQAPATVSTTRPSGAQAEPTSALLPLPKTWAKAAAPANTKTTSAPTNTKPTLAKSGNAPILNTAAIQKELSQLRAQKAAIVNKAPTNSEEDGWNVQGKGRKNKAAPATPARGSAVGAPTRKGGFTGGRQGGASDLEVVFKPESSMDIDLVRERANPNDSRSCLTHLVKHCNELACSKEYKDKTDIRVKSFSYSRNGNCIVVFSPKTNIKEVELFATGLCGVMGLKGAVAVQRTSGWTRMRVSHFPAWATDPDTGGWVDRINSKEEILAVLQDFAPHDLLTKFPPVDVRFFKPDDVVRQCQPGSFETIVISVEDPTGGALAAYTDARLSFGYRNSFVSTHTTCPRIAECKRCCSYQCPRPQACSAPMKCYKCGERHDPKNHDTRCSLCRTQKIADKPGHVCTCAPRCANCKGAHVFGDPQCPGRLKYAPLSGLALSPPLNISKYAPVPPNFSPPGGGVDFALTPGSQTSMRTPPLGVIPPRVQIDEDEVMTPCHD